MKIEEWRRIPRGLAFSKAEYQERLERLQAVMREQGLDALLLLVPESLCYLTGFQTPGYYYLQALVVPANGDPRLITRYLEKGNAFAFSWLDPECFVTYLDHEDPVERVCTEMQQLSVYRGRIGIEKKGFGTLSIAAYEQLVASLTEAEVVDGSGLVEQFRAIKSAAEIAHIREACRVSSLGVQAAVEHCRAGINERELAGHIDKTMVENGAEYAGLPLLLSSGDRTYIRHAVPGDKIIEAGDNVLVELTGVTWRYAGPLFRTLSVGAPDDALRRHSDVAKEMLEALIGALRPGVTSHEVNQAAVEVLSRVSADVSGLKRAGYSVGLNFAPDWGEGVFLDLRSQNQTVIEAGMVFHIPQTMRVGDAKPTAISETVLITADGCEVLTDYEPRDLIVV